MIDPGVNVYVVYRNHTKSQGRAGAECGRTVSVTQNSAKPRQRRSMEY